MQVFESDYDLVHRFTSEPDKLYHEIRPLLLYDINDEQVLEDYNEIQTLLNEIDFSRFVGWKNWYLRQYKKDVKLSKTKHYLTDGHKKVAEYIIQHDKN